MAIGNTRVPAPVLFEDPPPPEVLETFNALLSGMAAGFIQWCGHRTGPVSDQQVDDMLWRMANAAARAANRVWADETQPTTGSWPEL